MDKHYQTKYKYEQTLPNRKRLYMPLSVTSPVDLYGSSRVNITCTAIIMVQDRPDAIYTP